MSHTPFREPQNRCFNPSEANTTNRVFEKTKQNNNKIKQNHIKNHPKTSFHPVPNTNQLYLFNKNFVVYYSHILFTWTCKSCTTERRLRALPHGLYLAMKKPKKSSELAWLPLFSPLGYQAQANIVKTELHTTKSSCFHSTHQKNEVTPTTINPPQHIEDP